MRPFNFICFLTCITLIASCKKHDFPPPGFNEKFYTLKKLVHGTQEFNFYFNKKRQLDSVVSYNLKDKMVYDVVWTGDRISEVYFFRNGFPVWLNNDVEYDNEGNITRFNNRVFPSLEPAEPVEITYENGHIRSITDHSAYLYFLTHYDTLTYNEQDDITRWSTVLPRSIYLDVKYYTYDDRYNPLYFIDDLLIVFSQDSFLWEFFLSKHNSVSKYYELDNETVNYENFYDNKKRITKKRFAERFNQPLDSLLFEYVK